MHTMSELAKHLSQSVETDAATKLLFSAVGQSFNFHQSGDIFVYSGLVSDKNRQNIVPVLGIVDKSSTFALLTLKSAFDLSLRTNETLTFTGYANYMSGFSSSVIDIIEVSTPKYGGLNIKLKYD